MVRKGILIALMGLSAVLGGSTLLLWSRQAAPVGSGLTALFERVTEPFYRLAVSLGLRLGLRAPPVFICDCCPPEVEFAPPIDLIVESLYPAGRSLILSGGTNAGVVPCYKFTVYRGDQFVAKVQVMEVGPDSSVAEVLLLNDGQEIQPGDNAATQL
jgi:hypothetical protein